MSRLLLICQVLKEIILKSTVRNNRGFSLIELLLSLAVGSIILLSLYTILSYTLGVYNLMENEDEILLSGRHAVEYIREEIERAEEIIDIEHERFKGIDEKHEDNIGFVIMRYILERDDPEFADGRKYNYSTYYIKNNKLYRIAANSQNETYPRATFFGGHNVIAEHVVSFANTEIDFNTGVIDLCLNFKNNRSREMVFPKKIKIRCPVIY